MAPIGEAYNVDWVISTGSNVHVANNRDWFTSFTPFETYCDSVYSAGSRLEIVGIGTVQLTTKLYKQKRGGQTNSRTITLHNVLYAPEAVCNIFGLPTPSNYNPVLNFGGDQSGWLADEDDNRVGLIEILRLPRLRLHGQRGGKSSLDANATYMINAQWPATERVRWEARKGRQPSGSVIAYNGDAPYTTEETAWLKKYYDGEYKFLQSFGLSIYKEEDREDGRSIARTIMAEDNGEPKASGSREQDVHMGEGDSEDDGEDDSEDDMDDFLQELEDDPMSHLADYNFSDAELKWIRKHYKHSANFMLVYGLKPFNQDDCDEAKTIIKVMMDPN